MSGRTFLVDLREGLRRCLSRDPNVYVWGEDVVDPYGGAFKVTAGLSTEFPGRVVAMPISEAAIVGMGAGAALRGLRPVVEIMFGDFLTLAADQLVNHAAKFEGMYDGKVRVPLVVRTPMGGGRGYGPTHSQSLEKHFLGVPGLRVVAPSHFVSPGELLEAAVLRDDGPVLFVEHKLLYPVEVVSRDAPPLTIDPLPGPTPWYPTVRVRNFADGARPDVVVAAYGGISRILHSVMKDLADEEVWVEAFLPTELSARSCEELLASVRQTRRVALIEEGTAGFGWTAEVGRRLAERLAGERTFVMRSIEARDAVIPAEGGMEQAMLPSAERITKTLIEIIRE